ncbi:MAG: hypothetical protein H6981_08825 [Gammaproteobacteria bacterium]|nr:hypothetical protein [Gammaproteobacteria bacterium]MCP5136891.1 hypothetical protein [Gammaproteobacteria bacterium]
MSPTRQLLLTGVGVVMLSTATPANAFFCLMMNALTQGSGGIHISGHMGGRPLFNTGPMAFNPGYSAYYPPRMMPPPYWASPPVPPPARTPEFKAEPAVTQ